MSLLKEKLLSEFPVGHNSHLLIRDKNRLISINEIYDELLAQGYSIFPFTDSVEFRFIYETEWRSCPVEQKGKLALHYISNENDVLPYDIVSEFYTIDLDFERLFPGLHEDSLIGLDPFYLEKLYELQKNKKMQELNIEHSYAYILKVVFSIDYNAFVSERDVLKSLIKLHHSKYVLPSSYGAILSNICKSKNFNSFLDQALWINRAAFLEKLKNIWILYLKSLDQVELTDEIYPSSNQNIHIDYFEDVETRGITTSLFLDDLLTPVDIRLNGEIKDKWILPGINVISDSGNSKNLVVHLDKIRDVLKVPVSNWQTYIDISERWAVLKSDILVENHLSNEMQDQFRCIEHDLDKQFGDWIESNFGKLLSLPSSKPVVVNQLGRFLGRQYDESGKKVSLIVIDGLAYDQWITIEKSLIKSNQNLICQRDSLFAFIPTVTSVSRQSIFSGKIPKLFESSIKTTSKEKKQWQSMWESYGVEEKFCGYLKNLGLGNPIDDLESSFNLDRVNVLGLVINTVDDIMHGMQLGDVGMHSQISLWLKSGYLRDLLNHLLDHNFDIWITSDHGNKFSRGVGRLTEGVIAEQKGERVRVYPTAELKDRFMSQTKYGIDWPNHGLPDDYYCLIAKDDTAFISESETIVGHGGISFSEVVVPFVRILRNQNFE